MDVLGSFADIQGSIVCIQGSFVDVALRQVQAFGVERVEFILHEGSFVFCGCLGLTRLSF